MIVIVCPGQGAQTPGFMTPWLEVAEYRASIEEMQLHSGLDLQGHGTVSDAETIRDTAIAQPLIVASGVATIASIALGTALSDLGVAGIAGHSVGEITAAVGSGILSPAQGISFVQNRGVAMKAVASLAATGMAAILGGDLAAVEAKLNELGLQPANYNGAGQVVAAGLVADIERLVADPPAGSRVIPLQVAGAFHTKFMASAVNTMAEIAAGLEVEDPALNIWSNSAGQIVSSGRDYLNLMVSQISNPVRWDECMRSMVSAGVTALIEVAPAGTLVGLAKRAMPGIETLALKSPDNLDAARLLIKNHS